MGFPIGVTVRIVRYIALKESGLIVAWIPQTHLKNAFNVIDGLVNKFASILLAFVFEIRDRSVMPRVTEANVAKYK